LTSGSIRSGIKRLVAYSLICKDSTDIWRIKNEGMQAWLHLLLTTNDSEKAESLRFGEWDSPTSKQSAPSKAVPASVP